MTKEPGRIRTSDAQGFTLVEICMVVLISGLLFSAFVEDYSLYLMQRKIDMTRDSMTAANAQIGDFFGNWGRFPCPADRALASTNPNFGKEVNGGACTPGAGGVPAVGACSSSGGLCVAPASAGRAPYGAGSPLNAVIIGALPVASLSAAMIASGINDRSHSDIAFDGWDRQYLYAVTVGLTDAGNFKFDNGTINAVDENGNGTAGISGDAHYVLLSHGQDGNGAWTRAGVRYSACGTVAAAKDNENCNDDSTFVEGIINSLALGGAHFDDAIYFMKSQSAAIWAIQNGTNNIYSLNTGRIGIGTTTPSSALDVAGVVAPSTTAVLRVVNTTATSPNAAAAQKICKKNGTDCFGVTAIAGTGITCGAGMVMRGLQTVAGVTQAVCIAPVFSAIQVGSDCPPGQWLNAIDSNGNFYCR